MSDYDQRRDEVLLFRAGGSPARSAAAWLSAINRAEREGRPCPGWGELEEIAPSLPLAGLRATLADPEVRSFNRLTGQWEKLNEPRDTQVAQEGKTMEP